jgi:hypothetical protein
LGLFAFWLALITFCQVFRLAHPGYTKKQPIYSSDTGVVDYCLAFLRRKMMLMPGSYQQAFPRGEFMTRCAYDIPRELRLTTTHQTESPSSL